MKLLAVAGEPSGDAHGGPLIAGVKRLIPALEVEGVGGPLMENAGLSPVIDFSDLQIHGLVEVVRHLPRLYRVLWSLERRLDEARPDAVLLIDYPGFNLKLARAARTRGIPVIFYSAPQVWAWRRRRLRTIARAVDTMIVLFPFEVPIYRDIGVQAAFVGHPLVGVEAGEAEVTALRQEAGLDSRRPVVAVMPGSRPSELERNLPPLLRGIALVRETGYDGQFVLPVAPGLSTERVARMVAESGAEVRVMERAFLPLLKTADLALVASGTATLQVGLAGIPFVVVYRVSPLTYLLARAVAYVKHISIVNILAGRAIVPELLQGDLNPRKVCETFLAIAEDEPRQERIRRDLRGLAGSLGEPGAYDRAAALIAEKLQHRAPSNEIEDARRG